MMTPSPIKPTIKTISQWRGILNLARCCSRCWSHCKADDDMNAAICILLHFIASTGCHIANNRSGTIIIAVLVLCSEAHKQAVTAPLAAALPSTS